MSVCRELGVPEEDIWRLYHFLSTPLQQGLSPNPRLTPSQRGGRPAKPITLVSVLLRIRVRDVCRDTQLAVRMLGSEIPILMIVERELSS